MEMRVRKRIMDGQHAHVCVCVCACACVCRACRVNEIFLITSLKVAGLTA